MNPQPTGQVSLSELLFTMSWEDPESDRRALRIEPGEVLLTITSGGCNTLNLLLQDPGHVYAVDINSAQSHLLELKIAAMRKLEHAEYLAFLGVRSSDDRLRVFEAIRPDLSSDAVAYWSARRATVEAGLLGQGRFERFVGWFRVLLRALQGKERIDGLFRQPTPEQHRDYFDRVWNTRRFRMLFRVFFSKRVLARRGLSADYFRFDDGAASFAESFYRRARRVLRDVPVVPNYFVAQYLLGRYHSAEYAPDYLLAPRYETIRSRLDRITIVTADAKAWLEQQPPGSIDCFSLSNICELMDLRDTRRTFEAVARTGHSGSRLCFRNLMVSREVPEDLNGHISRDESLSKTLLSEDRSFVYGRVDALTVN